MSKILKSPAKYVQGPETLKTLDQYLQGMGNRLLIIISQSGTRRICPTLEQCFAGKDYVLHYEVFQGECSQNQIDRLVAAAKDQDSTVVIGIGLVTPPVGMCIYVACDLMEMRVGQVMKTLAPFIFATLVCIALMIAFPQLILLPTYLMN